RSGRRPAERGRRSAGASGLARSKGPPARRDDDGREQKGNVARPRSRPHVLIAAEPSAIDRGILLRTEPEPTQTGPRLPRRFWAAAERKTPPRAGAVIFGRIDTQGAVRRSPPTNAAHPAAGPR